MNWLFKEEPTHYSFDALVKDKKTVVERGEESARAEAPARGQEGRPDLLLPHRRRESGGRDREGARRRLSRPGGQDRQSRRSSTWRRCKKLPRPVTLAEIKADPSFKDFPLVRISRLSVMPVTDAEWKRIEDMAGRQVGQVRLKVVWIEDRLG